MMRFVSDEVIQEVYDVRRKILPGCRWNGSAASHRKLDQVNHPTAAAWKRAQQFRRLYRSPVDGFRNYDAVTRADHLDPCTAGIVNVRGEGPDGATRVAGNIHGPQLEWQVLNKKHRHAVVCFPRRDQRLAVCKSGSHLKYRISDMNPRINLSPQIAADVPTPSANIRFAGTPNWTQSARPPARMKPKRNLKIMVKGLTIYLTACK